MNIACWFSLFFSLFAVVYYVVGMQVGKKTVTESDYFLANRSLGFWSLTGTLLATQIGSGLILGIAHDSYRYGVPGIFYGVGIAVGFVVLGCGVAGALRGLNVATTAEIFEKYFHSPSLTKVASFLSIVSLTGIFLAQVVASRSLMIGLGVESDIYFLGFWAILVIYTMYGGLPAVVATDLLQLAVIVTIIVGLFGYLLVSGIVTGVTCTALAAVQHMPEGGFAHWFSYLGMPFLFSLVEQDLAQRFFSARSSLVATSAAWASAVGVLAFAFIPALIGMQAQLSGITLAAGQSPFIVFVSQVVGPVGQALVMCALVAAIASTADSLLCAITSNVVQDFVPLEWGSFRRMRIAELVTGIVGVVGVVGSYFCDNILGVLIQSYELLVCSILVSVLVCLLKGPLSYAAAVCSVSAGFLVYSGAWLGLISISWPHSCVALGASVIGYGVGLAISRLSHK